jgi:hypothetical protein
MTGPAGFDDLLGKLDQPRAESYRFAREGDVLAGTVRRVEMATDSAGARHPVVVLEAADGQLRSLWVFHDALLSQMRRLRPRPGDRIAVRYNGKRVSGTSRAYHDYDVVTDREAPGFDWDDSPAAPAPAAAPGGGFEFASDVPLPPEPPDEPPF